MAYVTAQEIRDFLGVGIDVLPDGFVERYIAMAEDYVDRLTNTCWGGKVCSKDEWEYHSLTKFLGGLWFGAGIPVHLEKRDIRRITALEVFNGSVWEDWLGTRTEARNVGDWWVDYTNGVLYVNAFWFYQGGKELRVKYEYGRDDLPGEVRELTMVVALQYMIAVDRRRFLVVESQDSIGQGELLNWLRERQKQLESMLRSVKVITGTFY